MKEIKATSNELKTLIPDLAVGDKILLSGTVYTARDAAHARIFDLIKKGETLPFSIENSVIYYAGPTPTPENMAIGSCGPTTSKRMDPYSTSLYDMGLTATIGKGERGDAVIDAIKRNGGIYLCALGGAGALAALSITDCQVIAFEDLGCESVKKLEFKDFPLYVGIDCKGNSIFERG